MIQFFHVYKSYLKDVHTLSDISLHIEKGDFVFLTGASGAGKTTLLKLMFCAERASQGQILINNVNVSRLSTNSMAKLRRNVGVVFQDFQLLPHRTVLDNISFPLVVSGVRQQESIKRVRVALKNLNLEHKMHFKPPLLSGGEQQRIAIARAIVNSPMLLLADEPTGNLDAENTEIVMGILNDINARGTTVVVATHDQNLINRYHRRVIHLNEGRIETP